MARTLLRVLAFGTVLVPAGASGRAPQATAPRDPTTHGNRVANGGDVGRYAGLYGTPEFRALDDEGARPWPERRAIRTIGRLEEIPGRGRSGETSPNVPSGGSDYDHPVAVYRACAERHCLALVPVEEMRDVFYGSAVSAWLHQDVEVVGAIDELPTPSQDPRPARRKVFLVWSILEPAHARADREGATGSSLEALVRYPKGGEGRSVTASGVFRGANLFDDLSAESRLHASDWVLKDGPFSIWVTGKAPKGKGFSLDPRSRSDCRWRLEVSGRVETAGGYVYLRAKSVTLVRRETDEATER